jgi:hypothetical protein
MPGTVLEGVAWIDENCDGLRDSTEPPLLHLPVYLFSAGEDGIVSTADDQVIDVGESFTTGAYAFHFGGTGIDYRLTVLLKDHPLGFRPAPLHQGSDPSIDNDLTTPLPDDPNYWSTGAFRLDADHTVTGVDIGFCRVPVQHLYLPVMRRS